jgi:hypothetical protein
MNWFGFLQLNDHFETNSVIFNKWVEEQLVPALPPKSLVVMDNASYHSVIKEGTKAPTSATRKGDMQKWLNPFIINCFTSLVLKVLFSRPT